jgi:hypothetical protein
VGSGLSGECDFSIEHTRGDDLVGGRLSGKCDLSGECIGSGDLAGECERGGVLFSDGEGWWCPFRRGRA